ncbi:hypothetical protein WJX84_006006 [Apatococcus fuscideae]|uniref:Uncharacterized protein n=1 Tax=Apatococcus fuscideae TaxID=2026836 RepID=A0AAW1RML4_9CHLO
MPSHEARLMASALEQSHGMQLSRICQPKSNPDALAIVLTGPCKGASLSRALTESINELDKELDVFIEHLEHMRQEGSSKPDAKG